MFGDHDFFERRLERMEANSRIRELSGAIENASYNGYQQGQAAGLREGEEIGFQRGVERGIDICLQILENHLKKT